MPRIPCLIAVLFLVTVLAHDASSAVAPLITMNKHFSAATILAHAQGETASRHFDSPLVQQRVSVRESGDMLTKLANVSLNVSSGHLLAADILARNQGETASHHFDSPSTQRRVGIEERERVLSEIIGTRVIVQPLHEATAFQKHVRHVTIQRPFEFTSPLKTTPYLDQHGRTQHVFSVMPFFFSIAPSHYDAYAQSKIPVAAVDIIKIAGISLGFKMSPSMLAAARELREKAMKARFFPSPQRPRSASTGKTMLYRLTLPLDSIFHPNTFSHSLLDLGDVLKITAIYCARQGLDFHAIYPQIMPDACIVPVYANQVEESRFFAQYYNNKHTEDAAVPLFVQMFAGPTFRLIKEGMHPIYMQHVAAVGSNTPWPSLTFLYLEFAQILLSRHCEFVANPEEQRVIGHAVRFRPFCCEDDECKTRLDISAELAKAVQLDIEIPASTPEAMQMLAAVVELRRLPIHIDLQEEYLMAMEAASRPPEIHEPSQ